MPIWTTKPEAGRQVRQRIGMVMRWAVAQGYAERNPAGDAIAGALPRNYQGRKHFKAVPHAQVAGVIAAVRASNAWPGVTLLFEYLVLTAVRSGEARGARWDEINLESAMWTVPAERTKVKREHRVALSVGALAILEQAREFGDGQVPQGLVFPSKTGRFVSGTTVSRLLLKLEVGGVPHGFRSSFRNWCGDTSVPREVAEACLGHTVGNSVEAAYARSDLFERRRPVMEAWAEYVRPTSSGLGPTPRRGPWMLGELLASCPLCRPLTP